MKLGQEWYEEKRLDKERKKVENEVLSEKFCGGTLGR